MLHGDLYCAETTMHRRLQDKRTSFEALRLRRRARLAGALQPGWMARQGCELLSLLGLPFSTAESSQHQSCYHEKGSNNRK